MSEMMDKSTENPDEDRISVKSNGKTPTKDTGKLGMMKSFRNSVRRAVSPFSSGGKGSKVTSKAESVSNESPQSPSK